MKTVAHNSLNTIWRV